LTRVSWLWGFDVWPGFPGCEVLMFDPSSQVKG
jgi:hypothetical protein